MQSMYVFEIFMRFVSEFDYGNTRKNKNRVFTCIEGAVGYREWKRMLMEKQEHQKKNWMKCSLSPTFRLLEKHAVYVVENKVQIVERALVCMYVYVCMYGSKEASLYCI